MNGANCTSAQRLTSPRIGGTQFLTPTQKWWRSQQLGRLGAMAATAAVGTHAPVRAIRKHPTGAASMETLEPTASQALYRSVLGTWGRPTKAGH